eukprot:TRINITY_DN28476_c3_g1_i1.p1 TRINITY_DN28476_c3_g1~~TRINITY_DN28476_c3_g1_i1.p1  ORF type:complete len:2480 (+),score=830.91 TRINITY_DN28476_c3_g1_i1:106-7440(+)
MADAVVSPAMLAGERAGPKKQVSFSPSSKSCSPPLQSSPEVAVASPAPVQGANPFASGTARSWFSQPAAVTPGSRRASGFGSKGLGHRRRKSGHARDSIIMLSSSEHGFDEVATPDDVPEPEVPQAAPMGGPDGYLVDGTEVSPLGAAGLEANFEVERGDTGGCVRLLWHEGTPRLLHFVSVGLSPPAPPGALVSPRTKVYRNQVCVRSLDTGVDGILLQRDADTSPAVWFDIVGEQPACAVVLMLEDRACYFYSWEELVSCEHDPESGAPKECAVAGVAIKPGFGPVVQGAIWGSAVCRTGDKATGSLATFPFARKRDSAIGACNYLVAVAEAGEGLYLWRDSAVRGAPAGFTPPEGFSVDWAALAGVALVSAPPATLLLAAAFSHCPADGGGAVAVATSRDCGVTWARLQLWDDMFPADIGGCGEMHVVSYTAGRGPVHHLLIGEDAGSAGLCKNLRVLRCALSEKPHLLQVLEVPTVGTSATLYLAPGDSFLVVARGERHWTFSMPAPQWLSDADEVPPPPAPEGPCGGTWAPWVPEGLAFFGVCGTKVVSVQRGHTRENFRAAQNSLEVSFREAPCGREVCAGCTRDILLGTRLQHDRHLMQWQMGADPAEESRTAGRFAACRVNAASDHPTQKEITAVTLVRLRNHAASQLGVAPEQLPHALIGFADGAVGLWRAGPASHEICLWPAGSGGSCAHSGRVRALLCVRRHVYPVDTKSSVRDYPVCVSTADVGGELVIRQLHPPAYHVVRRICTKHLQLDVEAGEDVSLTSVCEASGILLFASRINERGGRDRGRCAVHAVHLTPPTARHSGHPPVHTIWRAAESGEGLGAVEATHDRIFVGGSGRILVLDADTLLVQQCLSLDLGPADCAALDVKPYEVFPGRCGSSALSHPMAMRKAGRALFSAPSLADGVVLMHQLEGFGADSPLSDSSPLGGDRAVAVFHGLRETFSQNGHKRAPIYSLLVRCGTVTAAGLPASGVLVGTTSHGRVIVWDIRTRAPLQLFRIECERCSVSMLDWYLCAAGGQRCHVLDIRLLLFLLEFPRVHIGQWLGEMELPWIEAVMQWAHDACPALMVRMLGLRYVDAQHDTCLESHRGHCWAVRLWEAILQARWGGEDDPQTEGSIAQRVNERTIPETIQGRILPQQFTLLLSNHDLPLLQQQRAFRHKLRDALYHLASRRLVVSSRWYRGLEEIRDVENALRNFAPFSAATNPAESTELRPVLSSTATIPSSPQPGQVWELVRMRDLRLSEKALETYSKLADAALQQREMPFLPLLVAAQFRWGKAVQYFLDRLGEEGPDGEFEHEAAKYEALFTSCREYALESELTDSRPVLGEPVENIAAREAMGDSHAHVVYVLMCNHTMWRMQDLATVSSLLAAQAVNSQAAEEAITLGGSSFRAARRACRHPSLTSSTPSPGLSLFRSPKGWTLLHIAAYQAGRRWLAVHQAIAGPRRGSVRRISGNNPADAPNVLEPPNATECVNGLLDADEFTSAGLFIEDHVGFTPRQLTSDITVHTLLRQRERLEGRLPPCDRRESVVFCLILALGESSAPGATLPGPVRGLVRSAATLLSGGSADAEGRPLRQRDRRGHRGHFAAEFLCDKLEERGVTATLVSYGVARDNLTQIVVVSVSETMLRKAERDRSIREQQGHEDTTTRQGQKGKKGAAGKGALRKRPSISTVPSAAAQNLPTYNTRQRLELTLELLHQGADEELKRDYLQPEHTSHCWLERLVEDKDAQGFYYVHDIHEFYKWCNEGVTDTYLTKLCAQLCCCGRGRLEDAPVSFKDAHVGLVVRMVPSARKTMLAVGGAQEHRGTVTEKSPEAVRVKWCPREEGGPPGVDGGESWEPREWWDGEGHPVRGEGDRGCLLWWNPHFWEAYCPWGDPPELVALVVGADREPLFQAAADRKLTEFLQQKLTVTGTGVLTFQTLNAVQRYFGVKLAFYFAFSSYVCAWFLLLAPLGLLATAFQVAQGLDNRYTPWYTVAVVCWAEVLLASWSRKASELALLWGVRDYELLELPRPEFMRLTQQQHLGTQWKALRITTHKHPLSYPLTNREEPFVPPLYHFLLLIKSRGVTALLLLCGFLAMYIVQSLRGDDDSEVKTLTVGVLIGAVVNIGNLGYKEVCLRFSKNEIHRTQSDMEKAMSQQIFIFYYMNSFASVFFSLARGRPMEELVVQVVALISINSISGFWREYVIIMLRQGWQRPQDPLHVTSVFGRKYPRREHRPEVAVCEKVANQAYCQAVDLKDFYDDFNLVAIQFGFVVSFGTIFPLSCLLCAMLLGIEIYKDLNKFLFLMQRPRPERAAGIGVWYQIMEMMINAGILINAFVVVYSMQSWRPSNNEIAAWLALSEKEIILSSILALFVLKYICFFSVDHTARWVRQIENITSTQVRLRDDTRRRQSLPKPGRPPGRGSTNAFSVSTPRASGAASQFGAPRSPRAGRPARW